MTTPLDIQTVNTESVTWTVEGMTCPGCQSTVESALAGVGGVLKSSVSLLSAKATITFDPLTTSEDSIRNAIESAGYPVPDSAALPVLIDDNCCTPDSLSGSAPDDTPSLWKSRLAVRTYVAGSAFFAALALQFLWNPTWISVAWWSFGPAALLYIIAAVAGGSNFFKKGMSALLLLRLDMNFLMSAAVVGATVIGEYTEAAAIAFLFSLSELLEEYSVARVRKSLKALVNSAPTTANLRRSGSEVIVSVGDVAIGEICLVRPGEKIPLDGTIVEGFSSVDESIITGESIPVDKKSSEEVFAGTLNHEGYLEIEITAASKDTTLARIIRLVESAEGHKAKSEQFVKKFARYYTPVVTVMAVLLMAVPILVAGESFALWFVRGLTLLVIACPCAMVISTPVCVISAITSAARHGVLVKGGLSLEALAGVKVVALDKTGTLTEGLLAVTDVIPLNGMPREETIRVAANLEMRSEHPIAKAVVRYAEAEAISTNGSAVDSFVSSAGQGISATVDGVAYRMGKPELFGDFPLPPEVSQLQDSGKTVVMLGTDDEAIAVIAVADRVKEHAKEAVYHLRLCGVQKIVMLTGDNERTARAVADAVGIDDVFAGLLPHEKVEKIRTLTEEEGPVAMVGDGVNDAPALAVAAVGVAMGGRGSDAAIETADVSLMTDDLRHLAYAVELSRAARRVIRQNVWTSILLKVVLALGVIPGMVTLITAILVGDMGASLGVTTNALRLAGIKPHAVSDH